MVFSARHKNMPYKALGTSGLQVSRLGLGTWLSIGDKLSAAASRKIVHKAFDQNINLFDTAEIYASGRSESALAKAIRGLPRHEILISSKLYAAGAAPTATGLSGKHLREGLSASLQRLRLEYVDLLFCHRPDFETPLYEIAATMHSLILEGKIHYWGTSEWPSVLILELLELCKHFGFRAPIVEQIHYNLLYQQRFDVEYLPLARNTGLGLMTWSPLASGFLSGKYSSSIPTNSRFKLRPDLLAHLPVSSSQQLDKYLSLCKHEDLNPSELAIAWCLRHQEIQCVLIGATSLEQLDQNLRSITAMTALREDLLKELDRIFATQEGEKV